jgi:hypothetical protein
MTKYLIVSPNGTHVCIIQAASKRVIPNGPTLFFDGVTDDSEQIEDIPNGWLALDVKNIVRDV